MNLVPAGVKRRTQEAIEIRLWEIYLTRIRNNIYNTLSAYSIDRGPFQRFVDGDRVSFRVMRHDWDRTISEMLASQGVPYEIVKTHQIDVIEHMGKKKIYLADDDLDILFALNTMLEQAGYDVLMSHCGMPMLQKNLPSTDLFILDKRMPDVDGLEVCRHLKNQPLTRDIPVIMISASRNFTDQAKKAGVSECLQKPFQMEELLNLVSKYTMNEVRPTWPPH